MAFRHALWRAFPEARIVWIAGEPRHVEARDLVNFAPEVANVFQIGKVLCLEALQSAGYLKLEVPLFSEMQLGVAADLGPLGLDVILSFCRKLRDVLHSTRRRGSIANSLLLVGAYLLIERSFTASFAWACLRSGNPGVGVLPEWKFPIPWRGTPEWSKDSLTIHDCLEGIEAAQRYQWLDFQNTNIEWRHRVQLEFDAVPVFRIELPNEALIEEGCSDSVQGTTHTTEFWVAADPMTTVMDPSDKPVPGVDLFTHAEEGPTLIERFEQPGWARQTSNQSRREAAGRAGFARQVSGNSMSGFARQISGNSMSGYRSRSRQVSGSSSASVSLQHDPVQELIQRVPGKTPRRVRPCFHPSKLDEQAPPSPAPIARPLDIPAFAKWLRDDLRCQLIARVNFGDEPGLPLEGSYTGDSFSRWGIRQVEAPIPDGTSPTAEMAVQILEEVVDSLLEPPKGVTKSSIMVHCKAGFGRSMCFLGALAVALVPGVRGGAFFGWARLVRPGSIQTSAQERFLRSLDEDRDDASCVCLSWRRKRASWQHKARAGPCEKLQHINGVLPQRDAQTGVDHAAMAS